MAVNYYSCYVCHLVIGGRGLAKHEDSKRCREVAKARSEGYEAGYKDGQEDVRSAVLLALGLEDK